MKNTISFRPTKAIVNLNAIKSNVQSLRKYLNKNTSIIAVVKANGYGHGDIEVASAVLDAGANILAVATPDEAIKLRQNGIESDILVLAPSPLSFVKLAAELRVTLSVSSNEWLEAALSEQQLSHPLKIHAKIDCGMGRTGLRDVKSLQAMESIVNQSDHLILEGVFMQFSNSGDEDPKETKEQYEKFSQFVEALKVKPRLIHVSNSAATFLYPEYALDAVRVGITVYGLPPSEFVQERMPFPLQRALTIETELSVVKLVEKGSGISYGSTYKTPEDEWIGTIPIGYADGFQRKLSGQDVLIGGERMPIIGAVCMDQCMIKLPREIEVGEKVVLIGKQGDEEIRFEEWAERIGTVTYEIITTLGQRIAREYS